jgi:hypothetical protein
MELSPFEKLIVAQNFKNLPIFHGTKHFVPVFMRSYVGTFTTHQHI